MGMHDMNDALLGPWTVQCIDGPLKLYAFLCFNEQNIGHIRFQALDLRTGTFHDLPPEKEQG